VPEQVPEVDAAEADVAAPLQPPIPVIPLAAALPAPQPPLQLLPAPLPVQFPPLLPPALPWAHPAPPSSLGAGFGNYHDLTSLPDSPPHHGAAAPGVHLTTSQFQDLLASVAGPGRHGTPTATDLPGAHAVRGHGSGLQCLCHLLSTALEVSSSLASLSVRWLV
jgi:hypothetical protein